MTILFLFFSNSDFIFTVSGRSIVYVSELAGLIKFSRPFLGLVSKAKAAKLVRALVDMFLDMEAGTGKEVSTFIRVCQMIHWIVRNACLLTWIKVSWLILEGGLLAWVRNSLNNQIQYPKTFLAFGN